MRRCFRLLSGALWALGATTVRADGSIANGNFGEKGMKRLMLMLLGMFLSSMAFGQTPPGGSAEFQALSGGTLSPHANHSTNPRSSVVAFSTIGPRCAYPDPSLPSGWVVTSASNVTQCSYPAVPGYYTINFGGRYYNQYTITSFYDIPVGGSLEYCSGMGVPAGWQVTNIIAQGRCDQMSDYVAQHVSCISGQDTNCYPQPSGQLSASPTTVYVPYGQNGSTTLSWSTQNVPNGQACVIFSANGSAFAAWTCGNSQDSAVWPWVAPGTTYVFQLVKAYDNHPLASVTVTGVSDGTPTIAVNPNPVSIPAGQTSAPITVTWNAPGYSSVSWYGSNSLPPYNGEILCLGSGLPASYTYNGHMSVGEIAKLYIVPNDACTAGSVVSSVPGTVLATVTATTQ